MAAHREKLLLGKTVGLLCDFQFEDMEVSGQSAPTRHRPWSFAHLVFPGLSLILSSS
jgi:hypothetical protein